MISFYSGTFALACFAGFKASFSDQSPLLLIHNVLFPLLCVCRFVLQQAGVCCLRFVSLLQQDPGMTHCVAVGTLPALFINIANPKVQKNVSFFILGKKMKENLCMYMNISAFI